MCNVELQNFRREYAVLVSIARCVGWTSWAGVAGLTVIGDEILMHASFSYWITFP